MQRGRAMREIRALEAALRGWPDELLTVGLLAVAGVLIVVALTGSPLVKAGTLAWAVFP